jgi:ribosomal protein L12E/L44/L45/RPP1/RPP2
MRRYRMSRYCFSLQTLEFTMKKILAVALFAFAFNAFAGTFAEEAKAADKAAKKEEKKEEKKDDKKKDEKKEEKK